MVVSNYEAVKRWRARNRERWNAIQLAAHHRRRRMFLSRLGEWEAAYMARKT